MESEWWLGLQPFLWLVTFRNGFEVLNAVLNAAFWLCPYYLSAKGVFKKAQEEKEDTNIFKFICIYVYAYCFQEGKGKRRTWKKHWHNIKKEEWEGPKCAPGEKKEFDPCNDQLAPTAIKPRSKNAQTLNAQTPCPHPYYILHDASKLSS